LPAMPTSRHRSPAVRVRTRQAGHLSTTTAMDVVPTPDARMIQADDESQIGDAGDQKRLVAARLADSRRLLCPMSRYEHQPMTSSR